MSYPRTTRDRGPLICVTVITVLMVSGASGQTISLSPTSLSFGNHVVGTSSSAKITLTNAGTAKLAIGSIATMGAFAETNTCGTTLSAGGKCSISVTFTPTSTGSASG